MRAPAKLNLVLEVLGKRSDDYHDISSILQTVNLCDELSFERSEELALHCDAGELATEDNLVLKAARLLKQICSYREGAAISLNKKIPWGAGLGGGSSDAATTLVALNRLWAAGLSKDELIGTASEIGSDVPFFIQGGTCLVEGRGEWLTALPDIQPVWFVLVRPGVTVPPGKTAALYKLVSKSHFTGGKYTADARNSLIKEGRLSGQYLYNAFDEIAFEAYPGLNAYRDTFKQAGAGQIHLAGSGPVLFTMLDDKSRAELLAVELKSRRLDAYVMSSLKRSEVGY